MKLALIFTILWAFLCYNMAEKRGRNAVIGAVLGALFGLFAVVGYLIVGNKED